MFSEASLAAARSLSERVMVETAQIQQSAATRRAGGIIREAWQTVSTIPCLSVPLKAEEVVEAQRRDVRADWALVLPWDAVVSGGARAIVDGSSGEVAWRRWFVLHFTYDPNAVSISQRWVCGEVDPW